MNIKKQTLYAIALLVLVMLFISFMIGGLTGYYYKDYQVKKSIKEIQKIIQEN